MIRCRNRRSFPFGEDQTGWRHICRQKPLSLLGLTIWKQANVVRVPKSNPPTTINKDLRPISLTPTVSKVLESFVGQWILDDLADKIDGRRYGALRGRMN